jgi:amino acid transporter
LYLEFARKLPHTGGELVYVSNPSLYSFNNVLILAVQLDETLPTPRLFTYTIYTFYFVLIYNTASNSMQFSNQILISANINNLTYLPDGRLLRFIAIVSLAFCCLLHYFSAQAGRTLNQILAFFKLCLLLIVFIAGWVRASRHYTPDWTKPSDTDRSNSALAFLLIMFSFSGWENATFVRPSLRE